LLVIAIFVVTFLEIHPFQDGNGRLSRVLTSLLLRQAGYAYVPYSSLESVVDLNKEAYYLALRRTQGTIRTQARHWQPWLVFFLRSLAEQVRRLEKKSRTRKDRAGCFAGAVTAHRRICAGAWAHHDGGCDQADRGESKYVEAAFSESGGA